MNKNIIRSRKLGRIQIRKDSYSNQTIFKYKIICLPLFYCAYPKFNCHQFQRQDIFSEFICFPIYFAKTRFEQHGG